jgi:hypothetical protein
VNDVLYLESDVPPGMTLTAWRQTRHPLVGSRRRWRVWHRRRSAPMGRGGFEPPV